jgi:hypothetical protein
MIRMRQRIQASALFYAVTVVLLVGLVMGALVLLTHFRTVRTERWLAQERAASNARSAAHLALHQALPDNGPLPMDLFGQGTDSAIVEVVPWGGLELVRASAWQGDQQAVITAFGGRLFDDRLVLDLGNKAGPLHLCGDARIRGDVRVPLADVRRGYIEGKPFTGERLVEGQVQRSLPSPIGLRTEFAERMRLLCTGAPLRGEQPITASDVSELSDHAGIGVISFNGPTHVKGLHLKGPVVLRCNDSLSIDAENELDLVLIQAPFIAIDPGARFSVQCFASRGILVGADAQLLFPSMLAVWRDDHRSDAARIVVDTGAVVQGALLAVDRSIRDRDQGSIVLAPRAVVQGEAYAEGPAQVSGRLAGTLVARELMLRTPASMYHGHLLDAVLERYDLGTPWGFGITALSEERTILRWGSLHRSARHG